MKTARTSTLGIAALVACMAGTSTVAAVKTFDSLALNLECLGAEFYSYAAFGEGISDELRGGGPASVGGRKAKLKGPLQDMVEEMAMEKAAHLAYLRDVMDDAPPCPAMDIGPAFAAAADAAAGMQLSPAFDPYKDDTLFLHAAFLLQDVFAAAYGGARDPMADRLAMSDSYFAGVIRVLLFLKAKAGKPTPYGPITDVVNLISDLRDSVDGAKELDQGIGSVMKGNTEANILPADRRGLPYTRTAAQTFAILFLGGESAGGFLPEGKAGAMGAPMAKAMPQAMPRAMRKAKVEPVVEEDTMVMAMAASRMAPAEKMCSGTCEYRIVADMVWNGQTHPVDYPAGVAHWSPFYIVTHDETYFLWRFGETANAGIQEIAETGAGEQFFAEVEACGAACSEGVSMPCDPFSGVCMSEATITVTPDRPYLSLASMVAPSPDWFTGVDSWPLCVNGEWIEGRQADVDPYDAGTDSGPSFRSPDEVTTPFEPVFNFRNTMPLSDSIFYNPSTGAMLTVGNIAVELVGCE